MPARIGDYELIEPLRSGSVGETFIARATRGKLAGSVVCLKVLSSRYRRGDRAMRRAAIDTLRREADIVSALQHPNIPALLDIGVHDSASYLAFELIRGCSLFDVSVLRLVLAAQQVRDIGLAVAGALACAHEKDIVHRDVTSSNILLSESGDVKLVGFGLAKAHAAEASHFTEHVGTPRYWSPEQIRGESLTPASDVFALGVVLYEALTRVHPFHDPDPAVFRQNVLSGHLVAASDKAVGGPLLEVLASCLHLDVDRRFQDAAALHRALSSAVAPAEGATVEQLVATVFYLKGDESEDESGLRVRSSLPLGDSQLSTLVAEPPVVLEPVAESWVRGQHTTVALNARALAVRVSEQLPANAFDRAMLLSDLGRMVSPQARDVAHGTMRERLAVDAAHSNVSRSAASAPERRAELTLTEYGPEPVQVGARTIGSAAVAKQRAPRCIRGVFHSSLSVVESGRRAEASTTRPGSQCSATEGSRRSSGSKPIGASIRIVAAVTIASAVLLLGLATAQRSSARAMELTQRLEHVLDSAQHALAENRSNDSGLPASVIHSDYTRSDLAPSSPRSSTVDSLPCTLCATRGERAGSDGLVDLTIGMIPYGQVAVDGRPQGRTPLTVRLKPGHHRIEGRNGWGQRTQTVLVPEHAHRFVMELPSRPARIGATAELLSAADAQRRIGNLAQK